MDVRLTNQLLAELREARGQLEQAQGILESELRYGGRYGSGPLADPQQAWLAWHKCQEAETNLRNVAVALEKGARQ